MEQIIERSYSEHDTDPGQLLSSIEQFLEGDERALMALLYEADVRKDDVMTE